MQSMQRPDSSGFRRTFVEQQMCLSDCSKISSWKWKTIQTWKVFVYLIRFFPPQALQRRSLWCTRISDVFTPNPLLSHQPQSWTLTPSRHHVLQTWPPGITLPTTHTKHTLIENTCVESASPSHSVSMPIRNFHSVCKPLSTSCCVALPSLSLCYILVVTLPVFHITRVLSLPQLLCLHVALPLNVFWPRFCLTFRLSSWNKVCFLAFAFASANHSQHLCLIFEMLYILS